MQQWSTTQKYHFTVEFSDSEVVFAKKPGNKNFSEFFFVKKEIENLAVFSTENHSDTKPMYENMRVQVSTAETCHEIREKIKQNGDVRAFLFQSKP